LTWTCPSRATWRSAGNACALAPSAPPLPALRLRSAVRRPQCSSQVPPARQAASASTTPAVLTASVLSHPVLSTTPLRAPVRSVNGYADHCPRPTFQVVLNSMGRKHLTLQEICVTPPYAGSRREITSGSTKTALQCVGGRRGSPATGARRPLPPFTAMSHTVKKL
jgi:hypothetical protein